MKKILKLFSLCFVFSFLLLASACTISLSKEDLEKATPTEKAKPKLKNIAKEYNGLKWSEYINNKTEDDYYGYFEDSVSLNELFNDNISVNQLYYQYYNCVYFYALGGCEKDDLYKKAYTPILYKDENKQLQFVKPTDVIDKKITYEYWTPTSNVEYLARVELNCDSSIKQCHYYYYDEGNDEEKIEVSNNYININAKTGRKYVVEVEYQDYVDYPFALINDYSPYNEEKDDRIVNQRITPEDGKYIIPLEEVSYYNIWIKGYEHEPDLNEYVKKHNSWSEADVNYYLNSMHLRDLEWNNPEIYKKDFELQDYYVICYDEYGKDEDKHNYVPVVYKNENGEYEFVFAGEMINPNYKYELYNPNMVMNLKARLYIYPDKLLVDDFKAYILDEMDASLITENSMPIISNANYNVVHNLYKEGFFGYYDGMYPEWDKNLWFDSNKKQYAAIKIDKIDCTNIVLYYTYDNDVENKQKAKFENGYYWIELKDHQKYNIVLSVTYEENDLNIIKEDLDGYPWTIAKLTNPYYSSFADFAYLIGDYPYFENSKYEMEFRPVWYDKNASGDEYNKDFDLLMYKHDNVYDFVNDLDIINKDYEYVYLSEVINLLFDCSEFSLEWDNKIYTVEIKYVDDLDFDNMLCYEGLHINKKTGRLLALKITSDDPNAKYIDLKIEYKNKPTFFMNGYYLIEYNGDSRCIFDCNLNYKDILDSFTVDMNETIHNYSGMAFDYLYGEEVDLFKYLAIDDLYQEYNELDYYKDIFDKIVWIFNDKLNKYLPVIKYLDEYEFEFVHDEDEIKENDKYDFWDIEKEKKKENKKQKNKIKFDVSIYVENVKFYVMNNNDIYNMFDFDFDRELTEGQQLVVYAKGGKKLEFNTGSKTLKPTKNNGFYIIDYSEFGGTRLEIKYSV